MANIGQGLAALDSYYREGDARKTREYVQAKRDSELSLLGDRASAERSGDQLRGAQNQSELSMVGDKTANAKAILALEAADLEGQAKRQPDDLKTKSINAGIGLANAENDQANVPASLQVKNNALKSQVQTSDATLKQLSMKLQQLAVQGVLDQQGQSAVVLGTIGQLISRKDKAGAINFANEIAKQGNVLPNTNGKTFTDLQEVRKGVNGAQGDGYVFTTKAGERIFTPIEAISGAMGKLKSGEYQFIHTGDGSVYSGNKTTGQVTQAFKGDPRAARAQHTPAEIQTMEYLVSKGVAKDVNQAWDMVRSSREKTRNSFITDFVAKNALNPKDAQAVAQQAGQIYDSLRQNQGPTNAGSNTPAAGTMDPQIKSLLGLP